MCAAIQPEPLPISPMSMQPVQTQVTPEAAVRAANRRFYAAFESLDIAQMEALWAHDDAVQCVQPGWDLLVGWDDVRERWARIFANTKRAHVALSNEWVRVEGDVGWAACTARVTTASDEDFDEVLVQSTNIFIQRDGEWLAVAHHASAVPISSNSTVQ